MIVLDELVDEPGSGRIFTTEVTAGLGDAAPGGRVRYDALARWMQDAAHADLVDAGIADRAVWVVRRGRVRVARFPHFGEHATVRTFCSALGRAWAEWRTTVTTPEGGRVEAVTLWVHLDPRGGRPVPLDDLEREMYAEATGGRTVRARLRHPPPPDDAPRWPWLFRFAELDLADHINNAAYWTPLEEELLTNGKDASAPADVELEFRVPAQPGPHEVVHEGARRWIIAPNGDVHASFLLAG